MKKISMISKPLFNLQKLKIYFKHIVIREGGRVQNQIVGTFVGDEAA